MTVFRFFGCFSLCLVLSPFFSSGFLLFPSFHECSALNMCSSFSAFTQARPDQTEPGWTRQKPSSVPTLALSPWGGRRTSHPRAMGYIGRGQASAGKSAIQAGSAQGHKPKKERERTTAASSITHYIRKCLTIHPSTKEGLLLTTRPDQTNRCL